MRRHRHKTVDMHNEKSISIKEEQTNEMCPEPSTMFLGDPLGDYWSSDHINEDLKPNLGWDENENNNAVVNTLLHTILEAESECCPPPLLVPKKELFRDHTLEISCLTDFIKEDPELNLEADETENISNGTLTMDHQQTTQIKEEETDCAPDEPGLMDCVKCEFERTTTQPLVPFQPKEELDCVKCEIERTMTQPLVPFQPKEEPFLQDPVKLEQLSHYVKQEVELKLDVDDSEKKECVKCEIERTTTQPLVPFRPKEEPFLQDPAKLEEPSLYVKQEVELKLDVDDSEKKVEASRSYASNNTRLLQSKEWCDFPVEETVSQGMSHNELEIGSDESKHFIMFHEGEEEKKEEKESQSASRLICSLMEKKNQIFICSVCLQSFTSKYRLMMHVFVHIDGVEPPKSVCKSCAEVFPNNVSLKKHLKVSVAEQDSSAEKAEIFDYSGKSFTHLGTLKGHAAIHTGLYSHKCYICGKFFTAFDTLKRHSLIHTGTRPHQCDICGKSFTQLGTLKRHSLRHTGTKPHKCDNCGKSFTQLGTLKRHSLIHTGTKPHNCDICGKSVTYLGTLKKHSLIHTGTVPHKCDLCGKSFTLLGDLKRHLLVHTGTKPHNCDICGKSFTYLSRLKSHALIHTGTNPHKCDICGKSFTSLGTLKRHSLIHTGTRPHQCDICGKSFTELGTLKRHSLIHTGTRPHKCDICGKSFTYLNHLKSHSLIHTGTKPHKCDICDKSFTELVTLKRHSLIHTGTKPHKCDICGKSFTQLGTLKRHSLIHTGTKPHNCDIGGKSFAALGTLKKHSLIHTGTKPHKCDICGKSFNLLGDLKRHLLVHTGTKPQ